MSPLIHQTILRDNDTELRATAYSTGDFRHLAEDVDTLGIAIKLSPLGRLEAFAVASPERVVYHKIEEGNTTRQGLQGSSLAALFSDAAPIVSAFAMPRLALHLRRELGLHVSGVDLSTLFVASKAPWSPADFVEKRVQYDVDRFAILALWYPTENPDEALRRLCLRAWLSAV